MARYLLLAPDAGGVPGRLKYVDDATAAPTVTDDGATRGVSVGSLWIDTVAPAVYVCVDASTGAAVWFETGGSGSGAPDDADYLVGTAHAGLSAEVVVGPTPGGELGGTWASPTVDATHSGSTHAAAQAAAEATAAAALTAHEGLADPHPGYLTPAEGAAAYEASGAVSTHAGLADPHAGYLKESDVSGFATPALVLGTAAAAGSATTAIRSDSTIVAFDATVPAAVGTAAAGAAAVTARRDHVHPTGAGTPSTQAFGDAAAIGSGPAGAMTDHKHAMPADPVTAHAAAGDPHAGYVLESAVVGFPWTGLYAPGSFTVPTGSYAVMSKRLALTTTQRATLAGTARLRIT